jgi:hypothetical protein
MSVPCAKQRLVGPGVENVTTKDPSTGVSGRVEKGTSVVEEELQRLLIMQFHQDSVGRYGTDSKQAHAWSQLLVGY